MTVREKGYWLAFSCFPLIGPQRFKLLKKYFGTIEKAWKSEKEDWVKIGFSEKFILSFINFRREFDLPSYLLRLKRLGINSLSLEDINYPINLKEIDSAPFVLYTMGEIVEEDRISLGVVGTRKVTTYGKEVTEKLTAELVDNKITIVSGLAYGVDLIAHNAAVNSGGRTIGVWAGGLDTVSFGFRKNLIDQIINKKCGAIVSEYPLGFRPMRTTFPQRNRIISGLSLGVLVTEAAEDSGSLITARLAEKQGKPVFAVPGPITSGLSKGTSSLLKAGNILVSDVKDILVELKIKQNFQFQQSCRVLPGNKNEEIILKALENESRSVDDLAKITALSVSELSGILIMMEIKGMVKNVGGSEYGVTH